MEPNQAKELQDSIEAARQALAAEGETDTGTKTFESPESELEYLRGRERERTEQAAVSKMVAEVAQGVKASQAAETERLSRLVQSELEKALGGDAAKNLVTDAVARASALRTGRKFVPDTTGDVGAGYGAKGGGAYIASHKLGEKATLNTFLCAVGRKDRSAIGDIQRACGMTTGYGSKALVEGHGATDGVAGPSGGYIVPVEFSTQLIDALYARVALRRGGAPIQQMRSPTFLQPRLTGTASASYIGETAAIPASQQTWDQVTLQAKKLVGMTAVSSELIADSDPAVADIVVRDLSRVIGLAEDYAFLYGVGSSTVPQGILSAAGITTIVPVDGTNGDDPAYDQIVDMETELLAANIPPVNTVWICHPRLLGALRKIKDDDERPIFAELLNPQASTLLGQMPTLNGKPVITSTQAPLDTISGKKTTELNLVELSQVLIGQVQELEIMSSNEASYVDGSAHQLSAWQNDLTIFRGILRSDVALLQPSAVVVRQGLIYA